MVEQPKPTGRQQIASFITARRTRVATSWRTGWQAVREQGLGQVQFWVLALFIGLAAGTCAILFRMGISLLQRTFYGADDYSLATAAAGLDWWVVMLMPILGGLVVGLILTRFTTDQRVRSVAHVIEGAAMRDGRVEAKAGIASALASLITLSTGGSTGREGPVVHIAGLISTRISDLIHADGMTARDLLGCAVAGAVAASFNAPIAGALFALEVILRHFAVHAFAPIVISAVAGAVISRLTLGEVTEFVLAPHTLAFYVEIPAFMLLGLVCGVVAVMMMKAVFFAEDAASVVTQSLSIPPWARPAMAGAVLGVIALGFPHIIGVGYETTTRALTGQLLIWQAVIFAVVKVIAVAVTVGGRMGGGMFSPSLMVGALTGLAFGYIATNLFPTVSGTETLYALAGMGAVAAAVLGAPISTALIVFELTGDWQTGLAVMVAVSLACAVSTRLVDRSFFLTQLERRDVHVAAGPQQYLLQTISVGRLMRPRGADNGASDSKCWELIEQGAYLRTNATLEQAMPLFNQSKLGIIPIVRIEGEEEPELLGAVFEVDALKSLNRALSAIAREEHS
ncbi:chloride channel protein [Paracoccaceae bacterium GXU_MW_L88]